MRPGNLSLLAMTALAAVSVFSSARADDDPWEVRLRGVYLDPANKSDPIGALKVPADAIHINSKWLPDVDFEYFFTPNWSSELLLTIPQSQTVTVGGTSIGTFKHLPPTLTLKYDFLPQEDFQPYVGVGVNFTILSDVNLAIPKVGTLSLKSTSIGPALQAGFDYRIADHWFLNADVKWFKLGSDVDLNGVGKVSTVHVDPYLFGIGIGYRFGGHPAPAAVLPVKAPAPTPPPPPPPPAVVAAPPPPPCNPPAGFKVDANCHIIDQSLIVRAVDFESNQAKLTAPSKQTLDEVAAGFKAQPGMSVEIQGHTDSKGSAAYNLKLSQHRAEAVREYLVGQGVSASMLSARGYGMEKPIASNDTDAGRAQNRRVEFNVSNTPAHVKVVSEGASADSTAAAEQHVHK